MNFSFHSIAIILALATGVPNAIGGDLPDSRIKAVLKKGGTD